MKRAAAAGCAAVAMVLPTLGCGGTSAPTRPSESSPAVSLGVTRSAPATPVVASWSCLAQSAPPGLFGAAVGSGGCPTRLKLPVRDAAAAAPNAPGSLSGSVSGSTVTLTWLAPTSTDPATSYVIEAGSTTGSSDLANFDTSSTATTFTVTGVPAGTYFVRVRARNAAGSSSPSNEIRITVSSSGPCSVPPGVPGSLTASVSGSSVTLTWTAGAGATSYVIEAGFSSGASNLASFDTGSAATSFSAPGVGAGTYYVRVRAKNLCGTSAASNEVVVTVGGESINISGTWSGTFVATGDGSEPITLTLTQTSALVTGTSLRQDPCNCEYPKTITGSVLGSTFTFFWNDKDQPTAEHPLTCDKVISGTAEVSGNSMAATWTQTQTGAGAPNCSPGTSGSGTFTVTKQ